MSSIIMEIETCLYMYSLVYKVLFKHGVSSVYGSICSSRVLHPIINIWEQFMGMKNVCKWVQHAKNYSRGSLMNKDQCDKFHWCFSYRSDLAPSGFGCSWNTKKSWKVNIFLRKKCQKWCYYVYGWINTELESFFMDEMKK